MRASQDAKTRGRCLEPGVLYPRLLKKEGSRRVQKAIDRLLHDLQAG